MVGWGSLCPFSRTRSHQPPPLPLLVPPGTPKTPPEEGSPPAMEVRRGLEGDTGLEGVRGGTRGPPLCHPPMSLCPLPTQELVELGPGSEVGRGLSLARDSHGIYVAEAPKSLRLRQGGDTGGGHWGHWGWHRRGDNRGTLGRH